MAEPLDIKIATTVLRQLCPCGGNTPLEHQGERNCLKCGAYMQQGTPTVFVSATNRTF